jgi:ankyrin repeat domain-containing protein 50
LRTRLQQIKHRTYLWLYLVFEEIRKSLKRTEKKFNSIIDNIPESIDEAYEHILNKSTSQAEAKILLSIIVAATRPLTLNEMDVALALTDQDNLSSYEELDLDGDNLQRRIQNLCGLFVYVADSRVQLFHQTAKEFLVKRDLRPDKASHLWKQSLNEQDCELVMARTCIQFLLLNDLNSLSSTDEKRKSDEEDEYRGSASTFMN